MPKKAAAPAELGLPGEAPATSIQTGEASSEE